MKLVKQYATEAEAYIDKGLLEDNGIQCVITENAMSQVFPAPDSGTGSIALYVPDTDYHQARALLAGDIGDDPAEKEEEEPAPEDA